MLSAPVFRISGIQDVMPGPSISAGRGQGAKDLRGISTITGKGNGGVAAMSSANTRV